MAEATTQRRTPRDLLRLFFRRRNLFLLSASLFAIAVLIGAHWVRVQYTSTIKFERRIDPTVAKGDESFRATKETLVYELTGLDAVERLGDDEAMAKLLGLDRLDKNENGELTRAGRMAQRQIFHQLRQNLSVRWDVRAKDVDLVSLSFTSADPEAAREVPTKLVANYIRSVSDRVTANLTAGSEFLAKQVDKAKKRDQAFRDEKIEMESENVGLLSGTNDDIDRRIQQTKADQDAVRRLLQIAKNKYARLLALKRQRQTKSPEPVQVIKGPNPELARLGKELREYKIELDLAKTLRHMTDSHPAIRTLQARIDLMEKRIREMPTEIVLQVVYGEGEGADTFAGQVAAAQSEKEILAMEYDRVSSQVLGYEKMMEKFGPVRKRYTRITSSLAEAEAETEGWKKQYRNAAMLLAAEKAQRLTQLATVQQAREHFRPAFPKLGHVLAIAFLGGLVFATVIVFLANLLDRTVASAEDAGTYFGVRIHGVVSEILTRRQRAIRAWRRRFLAPVVTVIFVLVLAVSTATIGLKLTDPPAYEKAKAGLLQTHSQTDTDANK